MTELNEREKYMYEALAAIANFGKGAKVVLRPYMDNHNIKWDEDEDVKTWMQKIAVDAMTFARSK